LRIGLYWLDFTVVTEPGATTPALPVARTGVEPPVPPVTLAFSLLAAAGNATPPVTNVWAENAFFSLCA